VYGKNPFLCLMVSRGSKTGVGHSWGDRADRIGVGLLVTGTKIICLDSFLAFDTMATARDRW